MNKSRVWLKLALVAGVVAALMVTSAARFFMPSANTRNGLVYSYVPGKTISLRSFGRELIEYNLTSKTQILPSSLANDVTAGAQVTVVAQCFSTTATSGCIALDIIVRQPVSSSGSAANSGATSPAAPVPTPTP